MLEVVLCFSILLNLLLILYIFVDSRSHEKERAKLIEMIFAKSLKEFHSVNDNSVPPHAVSKHEEVLKRWRDSEVRRDE